MEHVFSIEVIIHGYHEYQDVWDAPLLCEREVSNAYDTFQ